MTTPATAESAAGILRWIEIHDLRTSPYWPREGLVPDTVARIAADMQEYGPSHVHVVLVRPVDKSYEIVDGHHVLAAGLQSGQTALLCRVLHLTGPQAVDEMLRSNTHTGWTALELARHLRRMVSPAAGGRGKHGGARAVARLLNRTETWVREQLRALEVAETARMTAQFNGLKVITALANIYPAPREWWVRLCVQLYDSGLTANAVAARVATLGALVRDVPMEYRPTLATEALLARVVKTGQPTVEEVQALLQLVQAIDRRLPHDSGFAGDRVAWQAQLVRWAQGEISTLPELADWAQRAYGSAEEPTRSRLGGEEATPPLGPSPAPADAPVPSPGALSGSRTPAPWDWQRVDNLLIPGPAVETGHLWVQAPAATPELAAAYGLAPVAGTPIVCRSGDLWQLGSHRIFIGSCLDIRGVGRLMGGLRAQCIWIDPPYAVGIQGRTAARLEFANDTVAAMKPLLVTALSGFTEHVGGAGAAFYMAHPSGDRANIFLGALDIVAWDYREGLIWLKNQFVMGRGDHHYGHESIAYGYLPGGKPRGRLRGGGWHAGHDVSTVFRFDKPHASRDHATMKPIGLILRQLQHSCPPAGLVFDGFGGSGSTLLAADQGGFTCYMVEVNPRYAAVTLWRWMQATGKTPVRIDSLMPELGGPA